MPIGAVAGQRLAADALFRPAAAQAARPRDPLAAAPDDQPRRLSFSVFFGIVWGFPARYFFEHANHGQQLAMCVITATMMAGAAFIFAPIPAAAAAYVDRHGRRLRPAC